MIDFRAKAIRIGQRELALPAFFPSISSVKTNLHPAKYIQVLSSLKSINHEFLVSAYDLAALKAPEESMQLLAALIKTDTIVLMDSGNYESFWKNTQANWKQSQFHDVLQSFPYSLAFCYDEQNPPEDRDEHIEYVVSHWREDQSISRERTIIPIIHGTPSDLPVLCAQVAKITGVDMIAVAERRLGDGIISRAETVDAIRQELNMLGRYVALHLLGTGNPISVAIYSIKGADSFDGLEWCQTAVDHDSALLFHFSQSDFFKQQTVWADADLPFYARTLAHNLTFYTNWLKFLRTAISEENAVEFCRRNFPCRIFQKCAFAFGWSEK